MKKFIFIAIAAIAMSITASAQDILWGYYDGSFELGTWGTGKTETYSVYMHVSDNSLIGGQIKEVKIPLNSASLQDAALFVSNEVPSVKSGVATGDIANVTFTPAVGWNTIQLETPISITQGSFYIGITFNVPNVTEEANKAPLVLMASATPDGCSVVTSRTYRKWNDLSTSLGVTLPMQFTVSGISHEYGVGVYSMPDTRAKIETPKVFNVIIANHGTTPVENIDWTYTLNGETIEGHCNIAIPADFYGRHATLSIEAPAISNKGIYNGELNITKVNGHANEDIASKATHQLKVMTIVPIKTPLMEEFTGCWCGWCPRGWLALELMNQKYPGEFVAASYHNEDAMEITRSYPVSVGGFPAANMNRNHPTEPYYGDTNYTVPLGIEKLWMALREEITPANVMVEAHLNADQTEIIANASFDFCEDVENTNYGIAYIITADGLKGTSGNWLQHNYYSGMKDQYDGYLDELINQGEYLMLTYNDVVIAESHSGGQSYTGIIPSTMHEGDIIEDSRTFKLSDMNSDYGTYENLVQDKSKLNVIALMIDANTKAVINCAKAPVMVDVDGSDAIININDDAAASSNTIYTLDGRKTNTTVKGINIVVSNGKAIKILK